jgi:hypothetical protein
MKRQRTPSKDKDIRASAKALCRAAQRAKELGVRTGTPVYVLKNEQVVNILSKQPGGGETLVADERG